MSAVSTWPGLTDQYNNNVMGVLRHRALALFLLCVSLTSLCVLLLPSQRGSRLHKMVKETVSRELSHVIQSDGRRQEDHSLLAASPTLLSLLGSVKLSRSHNDHHIIADDTKAFGCLKVMSLL